LAENWLRAAVNVVAARAKQAGEMPMDGLKAILADTRHGVAGRTLAFDLIQEADGKVAEALMPGLIEDPSAELRRHPVARLTEQGQALLDQGDKAKAISSYSKALAAARDEDQIKPLAKRLRDLGETVNLPKHFGFLMNWKLIAPFNNADRKGWAEIYPPEDKLDLAASYEGKGKSASWVEFESKDEFGKVDFNKPFGMEKEVVGYATTVFQSGEEREAELRLGCKNGWKVWLNGELLAARDEYHRGQKLDQYKFPCRLKKGPNEVLVKCCQNEQKEEWTVQWEFQLRVCDATGTAILPVP
jgi:hypothetical protein